MKKKSSISLGPGASSLILIFVVLSMAVLAMLSLMTSRGDLRLSQRSAEVAEAVARLNEQAEERRMALHGAVRTGAAIPEEVRLEDGLYCWYERDSEHVLDCALDVTPEGTRWVRHSLRSVIASEHAVEFNEGDEAWAEAEQRMEEDGNGTD